ncbi:MAG TPA: hypothetical protein VF488_08450, partial [Gemmatimonadaceae bacterium]
MNGLAGSVARRVVRAPWVVIAGWVALGALATLQAPRVVTALTAESNTPEATESARASRIVERRFAHPLDDVPIVTLETAAPLDSGTPAAVLDSLTAAIARQPYARRVVSWRTTGDSTLIRRDHRGTALLVQPAPTAGDATEVAERLRPLVHRTLRELGVDTTHYVVRVTGAGALDADLRAVSEEDSRKSELRLA